MILTLLLILRILQADPEIPPEQEGGTGTAGVLLQMIEEVMEGDPIPWAKPITEMDTERVENLIDAGFLVYHRALWAVERDDQDE